eukprot:m.94816 g.94816  ORF g.94816 m.94816 type:complete len:260 (+) comp13027_c0_seq1:94-873(+)
MSALTASCSFGAASASKDTKSPLKEVGFGSPLPCKRAYRTLCTPPSKPLSQLLANTRTNTLTPSTVGCKSPAAATASASKPGTPTLATTPNSALHSLSVFKRNPARPNPVRSFELDETRDSEEDDDFDPHEAHASNFRVRGLATAESHPIAPSQLPETEHVGRFMLPQVKKKSQKAALKKLMAHQNADTTTGSGVKVLFTYDQVQAIVDRAVRDREEQLHLEFGKHLAEKLAEMEEWYTSQQERAARNQLQSSHFDYMS